MRWNYFWNVSIFLWIHSMWKCILYFYTYETFIYYRHLNQDNKREEMCHCTTRRYWSIFVWIQVLIDCLDSWRDLEWIKTMLVHFWDDWIVQSKHLRTTFQLIPTIASLKNMYLSKEIDPLYLEAQKPIYILLNSLSERYCARHHKHHKPIYILLNRLSERYCARHHEWSTK